MHHQRVSIGGGVEQLEHENDGDLEIPAQAGPGGNPGGAASSRRGFDVPSTPIVVDDDASGDSYVPTTPRASEQNVDNEEHQGKRLKPEDRKRARIQRVATEYLARIRSVKFGFIQWNSYEADLDVEKPDETLELWAGEDDLQFNDVPEDLWSDFNMERQPTEPPE